jgi:hypothetical protein
MVVLAVSELEVALEVLVPIALQRNTKGGILIPHLDLIPPWYHCLIDLVFRITFRA